MSDRVLKLGVIGVGGRGTGLSAMLSEMPDVKIAAVCDLFDDRMAAAADIAEKNQGSPCDRCADYRQLLARDDIEAVLIASSWSTHITIAIDSMKGGQIHRLRRSAARLLLMSAGNWLKCLNPPGFTACCLRTAIITVRNWRCSAWPKKVYSVNSFTANAGISMTAGT